MKKEVKPVMSLRLSSAAKALLKKLGQKLGITQAAVIELAIREKAERERVK